MSLDAKLALTAVTLVALFVGLGTYVAQRPLGAFDALSSSIRGQATSLAYFFTVLGYWPALMSISIIVFFVALRLHLGASYVIALYATQLGSQLIVAAVKVHFARSRPDDWLVHKELGFSHPSGHAVTAVVFYGGLLLLARLAPLPRDIKIVIFVLLGLAVIGISLSRIALGAHYPTDVLGGLIFGGAWLCIAVLMMRHVPVFHAAL